MDGLAYDAAGDILYGVNDVDHQLQIISQATGAVTDVGSLGFTLGVYSGLTFDSESNTLYLSSSQNLYSVNTTTGTATLIGSTGVNMTGLAFAPSAVVIPEPGSLSLLALGGLALVRWRRRS
jgi:hypothetical protein